MLVVSVSVLILLVLRSSTTSVSRSTESFGRFGGSLLIDAIFVSVELEVERLP